MHKAGDLYETFCIQRHQMLIMREESYNLFIHQIRTQYGELFVEKCTAAVWRIRYQTAMKLQVNVKK